MGQAEDVRRHQRVDSEGARHGQGMLRDARPVVWAVVQAARLHVEALVHVVLDLLDLAGVPREAGHLAVAEHAQLLGRERPDVFLTAHVLAAPGRRQVEELALVGAGPEEILGVHERERLHE